MGIKWRDFQMPKRLECDEANLTQKYGKFVAEPFERGFGITLGNSLRRVLLSSIEGAAAIGIKIDGISHEFSTIPNVLEDVTEICLNIKKLVVRCHSKAVKSIYIKKTKAGEVKAKDIICDDTVEVVNKDLHIATLTKDAKFNMEIFIAKGRGYVLAEINKKENFAVGTIALDSLFSPIIKVNYMAENTRVGQRTDYDKLILEIFSNGSISPKDALLYASNILQRHLDVFVNFGQLPEEEEEEEDSMSPAEVAIYEKLRLPVSELELSVRSANCLREAKIKMIYDLVDKTEEELLNYRNFGKKSLTEIKQLIISLNLHLGMQIDKKKLKQKK